MSDQRTTAIGYAQEKCPTCNSRRRGYHCSGVSCRQAFANLSPGVMSEVRAAAIRERKREHLELDELIETALNLVRHGRFAAARPLMVEAVERLPGKRK